MPLPWPIGLRRNIEGRWSNARSAATWEWADGSQFQSLGDISESVLYSARDANRTLVPVCTVWTIAMAMAASPIMTIL